MSLVKAWASCHGFGLVEVWRGLREDYGWLQKSSENGVAAYRFGSGHAGPAPREVWPLFDLSKAQSLARVVSQKLPELRTKRPLQGALQEGHMARERGVSHGDEALKDEFSLKSRHSGPCWALWEVTWTWSPSRSCWIGSRGARGAMPGGGSWTWAAAMVWQCSRPPCSPSKSASVACRDRLRGLQSLFHLRP